MSEVEGTDGRVLADRYRLGGVLGKGGMGTVWRAVDETLGRSVAVKELRFPGNVDDDEKRRLVTRTLREAKATARIRNTGAITVFDVVKEDDRPWIVMELVEGRSLADAIREDGPLTPRRTAEIGLVLLDVLKAAHAEGILHRDVKPSNVLLADADGDEEGKAAGGGRVVLGDFGIAQIDGDPSVTSTGMLVGAPSYISPERARGQKPGPPADLWSLGALLYASVEGHPPYDKGSAIATLTAVMTEPVSTMHNAGPLAEVISGLLVKDPDRRLDDAGARRLLTAIVDAPDRPATAPDSTRVLPMPSAPPTVGVAAASAPADPQPVPTDAPPAARKAAIDQARAREALRALRKAADPKEPARSGAAAPAGGRRAPLGDVLPRRTMVIVIAAVVVALLGTVIGVAMANSGDGSGAGKSGKSGGSTPSSAAHDKSAGKGRGKDQDSADKAGAPAAGGPSGSASAPSAPASAPAAGSGDALPKGWHVFKDSEGFSIALPKGWKRVGDDGFGVGSRFQGAGGANLLVDWTHTPGTSALGNWQKSARDAPGEMDDYHQIKVVPAQYRGYNAADWEYTRQQKGKAVHVLNRGMVTDSKHGYALLYTTPAGDWDNAANHLNLTTFFRTFEPAK